MSPLDGQVISVRLMLRGKFSVCKILNTCLTYVALFLRHLHVNIALPVLHFYNVAKDKCSDEFNYKSSSIIFFINRN